jgi:preprotein translocase subunit SecD
VRGFAMVHCIGILTSMFSAVFFSRGLVNWWYGGKKKLKTLAIGQVWRPETAPAGSSAYLGNNDAATDTAQAIAAATAKPKAPAGAQARAGKPTVRRRNGSGSSNTPQKPGSSR